MSTKLSETAEAFVAKYLGEKGVDSALREVTRELRQHLTPLQRHLLQTFALYEMKERDPTYGRELPDDEGAPFDYVDAGWALCPLPRGAKGPQGEDAAGWNRFENTVHDLDGAFALIEKRLNFGLCHAYSGTCAIDVDNYDVAKRWLAERGIDLDALLNAPDAVKITSGRAGRGKLIYRAPLLRTSSDTLIPLPSVQVAPYNVGDKTFHALEFRCATRKGTTVQDVLPPSIHPETGQPYRWELGPQARWDVPPRIPESLIDLWLSVANPVAERDSSKAPTGAAADDIRALLAHHDPDAPYDDWVKIGMALHHEFSGHDDGLALWDEWSSQGAKYRGTADLESHWRSFGNHPNPVTLRSLLPPRVADPGDFDAFDEAELLVDMSPKPERFKFLTLVEAFTLPLPTYIVDELLPEGDVGTIYGQPGSGKTFVAIDLSCAVARGTPWREKEVKQGGVVYVAAEDDAGVRMRFRAYAEAHGIDPATLPIRLLCDAPNFLDAETQRDLLLAIRQLAPEVQAKLVVVDTMASVAAGADENSSKDMSALIDFCKRVHKATGALVLLIHHEGKTEGRGPRGSSVLHGAFCVELLVEEGNNGARAIVVEKLKNGPRGAAYGFKLAPVALDVFSGKPQTSCILEHIEDAPERGARGGKREQAEPSGDNQRLVYRKLLDALPLGGDDTLSYERAFDLAVGALPYDPETQKRDRRRDRAREALAGLEAGNWIAREENDRVRVLRRGP